MTIKSSKKQFSNLSPNDGQKSGHLKGLLETTWGLTCVTASVGTLPATNTLHSSIGVTLFISSTDWVAILSVVAILAPHSISQSDSYPSIVSSDRCSARVTLEGLPHAVNKYEVQIFMREGGIIIYCLDIQLEGSLEGEGKKNDLQVKKANLFPRWWLPKYTLTGHALLEEMETVEGTLFSSTLPWLPKGQSSMLRDWPFVDVRRQKRKYVSQPGVKSIVSHDPVVVDNWRSSSKVKWASTCGTWQTNIKHSSSYKSQWVSSHVNHTRWVNSGQIDQQQLFIYILLTVTMYGLI